MICQAVMHEIMAYEKFKGYKPALLILIDEEFKKKFFNEIYEFTMKTDGADFKQPGKFMGVKTVWENVKVYGGSCDFVLTGEQR